MMLFNFTQDLRRQFSGALPLIQQEKFTKSLRELHENKTQQDIELNLVRRSNMYIIRFLCLL